jgi:hypothetical protein
MSVASFPDRGKDLRKSIGKRLEVVTGKGKRRHIARVYEVAYRSREQGDIPGALVETDCGLHLAFNPYDESMRGVVKDEPIEFHETQDGIVCERCIRSIGAGILGKSRKRLFQPDSPKRPARKRAETFQQARKRHQDETLKDSFAQAVFGVSAAEMKRRGIVTTGRGRGAKYALGDDDGSDNPGA